MRPPSIHSKDIYFVEGYADTKPNRLSLCLGGSDTTGNKKACKAAIKAQPDKCEDRLVQTKTYLDSRVHKIGIVRKGIPSRRNSIYQGTGLKRYGTFGDFRWACVAAAQSVGGKQQQMRMEHSEQKPGQEGW